MPADNHISRIVLFDGVCKFCDASVLFIIKRDAQRKFVFATLQSDVGQQFVSEHALPENLDTIVLIEGSEVFIKSDAVFRIVKELNGFWSLLVILHKLPRRFRDYCYMKFGNNRYRLFGKKELCEVLSSDMRRRFL